MVPNDSTRTKISLKIEWSGRGGEEGSPASVDFRRPDSGRKSDSHRDNLRDTLIYIKSFKWIVVTKKKISIKSINVPKR